MKTDIELHKLFLENPAMLNDLLGLSCTGSFRVSSEVFKDVNRSADLCWYSESHPEARIIEIQGYRDPYVFHRGDIERIQYSMRHPDKEVVLVVIFLDASFHPHSEPWESCMQAGLSHWQVLYLEEEMRRLAREQPDHPLHSVLAPMVLSESELKSQFNQHHKTLRSLDLPATAKRSLLEVFESLLMTRFQTSSIKELTKMLAPLGDLSKSVAYQEAWSGGREEGREEGLEEGNLSGQIRLLDEMFDQGFIDRNFHKHKVGELQRQLSALSAKRSKDQV